MHNNIVMSQAPNLRQQKKDLVRLSILEAASRLVAKGGTESLSLRKVADEVGASTMVVYSNFGSKEGLLAAIWAEAFRRLWELEEKALRNPDPLVRLKALGKAYRRNALSNPYFYKLVFSGQLFDKEIGSAKSIEKDSSTSQSVRTFEVLIETVDACQKSKQIIASLPANEIAAMLWSTAHGVISLELAGMLSRWVNAANLFEQAFDNLIRGLNNSD